MMARRWRLVGPAAGHPVSSRPSRHAIRRYAHRAVSGVPVPIVV